MAKQNPTYVFVDDGYPEADEYANNYVIEERPSRRATPRGAQGPSALEGVLARLRSLGRGVVWRLGYSDGRTR